MARTVAALSLALVMSAQPVSAQEWTVPAIIAHQAQYYGVSEAKMASLILCESENNPYAVGKAGELGLAQLHPRGLLPYFYRVGYTDPYDSWEATDFVARSMRGDFLRDGVRMSHWSCW